MISITIYEGFVDDGSITPKMKELVPVVGRLLKVPLLFYREQSMPAKC